MSEKSIAEVTAEIERAKAAVRDQLHRIHAEMEERRDFYYSRAKVAKDYRERENLCRAASEVGARYDQPRGALLAQLMKLESMIPRDGYVELAPPTPTMVLAVHRTLARG